MAALGSARDAQQAQAEAVRVRALEIQARTEELARLMRGFEAIGKDAAALNASAQQLAARKRTPDEMVKDGELLAGLDELQERMTAVLTAGETAGRRRARRRLRRSGAQGRFAAPADPRGAQQDRPAQGGAGARGPAGARVMMRAAGAARAGAARVRAARARPRRSPPTRARPARRSCRRSCRPPPPPPADRSAARRRARAVRGGRQLLVRPAAGGDRRASAPRTSRWSSPLYQTDATTHDIGLHTRYSPTLAALAEVARAAKRDGLQVMMFPIIRLSSPGPGQWRGTLAPRDRDAWFKRYGDLLGELGAVASVTGAARLVVGSELSSLEGDLDHWRPVIERVRAVFPGKLVYSANWDHYRSAALYDLVDEEGISGYFNLRDASAPADDATLDAGWRRARQEIEAWRVGRDAPVHLHRARLPLAQGRHRRAVGRGPRRHARHRRAAARVRVLPPRLGDRRRASTASTSGTGTATAASAPPATRPAASRPRAKCAPLLGALLAQRVSGLSALAR